MPPRFEKRETAFPARFGSQSSAPSRQTQLPPSQRTKYKGFARHNPLVTKPTRQPRDDCIDNWLVAYFQL
jgi:hypothetical protein